MSSSLPSKEKNATCDRTTADETEEQAASSFSMQNNTASAQFPSTSKVSSSSHKTNSLKRYIARNESVEEKRNKKDVSTHDIITKKDFEKRTEETEAHAETAKNVSDTDNILKEYNYNRKEVVNDDKTNKTKNKQTNIVTLKFSEYIPVPIMQEILNNRTSYNVQFVKGNLSVKPIPYKYLSHSYLDIDDKKNLLILGSNRNGAFDGDLVVASIHPESAWIRFSDGSIQRTGTIVCILEKVHPRTAVGFLIKKNELVLLRPRDLKIPMIIINPESLPPLYLSQLDFYENFLFLVSIDSWEQIDYASGKYLSTVGKVGEIEAELQTILLENNLDISPYKEDLLKGLPGSNYVLTDSDLQGREDWRHECIFTIDPATAVDIDDAISCKVLDNGNYEIGVHISDVTHYLEFLSPLDVEVSKRATTIYMPHKTYHMLPEKLIQLCSLAAGKDKLAFSVIWEMTPDGKIVKNRFAKTVIRSCCQMSHESAQAMIDNPEKSWPTDFVYINGDHTISTLSNIINRLFKLSIQLRKIRFSNGALRLNQPKLQISIDANLSLKNGFPTPTNFYLEEKKDSNSLIEEFMLLANITVATHLHTTIPETALLRIHRNPNMEFFKTNVDLLQKFEIHLDIETAGALQTSIHHYNLEYNPAAVNDHMKSITMAVMKMCSKTMRRSEYVCASTISSSDLNHYALNVPYYTHFTSPIRRYADCITHRLLYATIADKPLPKKWTVKLCSKIAANCNVKKHSAHLAHEQSIEMFFTYMVGNTVAFEDSAIVVFLKGGHIHVILCDTGATFKIDFIELKHTTATIDYFTDYVPTLIINWKKPSKTQAIHLFSLVRVRLEKICEEGRIRLKATLLRPI
ncbi:DIS3-like exonuclease 2 isoform X2 [Linepithema humile]|uniref:DIS3-like exonuclease 2 isoform X2 n=1 Tax=Linepithema humile TaxID=83485 RepID=UPI00351DE65E